LLRESRQTSPEGVDGETVRATTPVKPLSPVTVIVELPAEPTLIDIGVTVLAAIAKSTIFTVM